MQHQSCKTKYKKNLISNIQHNKPSPSQNGWLINIGAVWHVWRMLKEAGFKYLETRSLNQDPLENTFGVIRLHCGLNNNPTVGQFVDALKTSIINGLAFRDLRNTNCEADKTELLDNLHSFLEESDASVPHPSTNLVMPPPPDQWCRRTGNTDSNCGRGLPSAKNCNARKRRRELFCKLVLSHK